MNTEAYMFTLGQLSLASVFSLLVGSALTHFLAKDRARQDRAIKRFNAAAAALRLAFVGETIFLRGTSSSEPGDTYNQLKRNFPDHEKAVFQFREVLSTHDRLAFDTAWRTYYFPEGIHLLVPEKETHAYMLGQYISVSHEDEQEKKKSALANIENILVFAQEK